MEDFERFYDGSYARVLRAVTAVAGEVQDAQDCVQEAYVRAAMQWTKVATRDSPEAWVRRVAMNLAFDGHRRRRVRLLFQRSQREPEPVPAPGETSIDVLRALRRLPRAQQEVVLMHHMLGLTVEQVARDLGRPENTVKTQLARGRSRLAELLTFYDEVTAHD